MRYSLTNRLGEVEDVRNNWGWFFALGIILVILGAAVISSSFYATIFSVIVLGFFLLGAGIIQLIQAFVARKWSGVFLAVFLGILYLITGFFCVAKPAVTAVTITLWIAAFCFVIGLFKMISSLILQFEQWGWVFFNGLVTFLLGVIIYSDWPISGLWVIGLFIGVDLILTGWSWILLCLSAREEKYIEPR